MLWRSPDGGDLSLFIKFREISTLLLSIFLLSSIFFKANFKKWNCYTNAYNAWKIRICSESFMAGANADKYNVAYRVNKKKDT